MSIYTPKNLSEAQQLAELFASRQNTPFDVLMLHACYGHHWGGNVALTLLNTMMIKGQPAMRADSMAAICRTSGLVRSIHITEWTEQLCTMVMSRTDEADEITHEFSFTMEMAQKQGLARGQAWGKMPKQMLRARALTMGLRATYPEACSGMYSMDEMADADSSISDEEKLKIQSSSLGEDVK